MIKRAQLVVGPMAAILVLASMLGSPVASAPAVAETAANTVAALGHRVAVIQQYFDTATRGDADGAQPMFADNAVFIGAVADPQTTTYVAVASGTRAPRPLATPRTACADVS